MSSRFNATLLSASLLLLPVYAYGGDEAFTTLTINAEGQAVGAATHLTANLSLVQNAASAAKAQESLNEFAQRVAQQTGKSKAISSSFRDYRVWQDESSHGPNLWHARQSLVLESDNSGALFPIVAQLQKEGALLDGLSWSLGPDAREKLQHLAQTRALERMARDARNAADALHLHIAAYHQVNISSGSHVVYSPMLLRTSATPQRSSDDAQTVTAHVSAEIYLHP